MPYIKQDRRSAILMKDHSPDVFINTAEISKMGELNFAISTLCKLYLDKQGKNYTTINDIIGVLECAKLECYRQVAASYENQKKSENGPVY